MSTRIFINGEQYWTRGDVEPYLAQVLSQAFRTTGVQQRSDNTKVNRFVQRDYDLGVGWKRIDRETGRGIGGCWFATADIMHRAVVLPLLHNSQTHASPADHLRKTVDFKGKTWGFFEKDYSASNETLLVVREWDGATATWTGGTTISGTLDNAFGLRVWDAVLHQGYMMGLIILDDLDDDGSGNNGDDHYSVVRSNDGTTWEDVAGQINGADGQWIPDTVARRNNFEDDYGKALSFGTTLLIAVYADPDSTDGDGTIKVYKSTDAHTALAGAATFTEVVSVPSGSGPRALVNFEGTPHLVTIEGTYEISLSASTATQTAYGQLTGDPDDGRGAIVAKNGYFFIPMGSGDIRRVVESTDTIIGPATRAAFLESDGLPEEFQGHVTRMVDTPSPWLAIAYGGTESGKQAWIAFFDKDSGRFVPKYVETDTDVPIINLHYSAFDDATPRLHFALEGASASELYDLEKPLSSPLTGVEQSFQESGYVRNPHDDLGDPQTEGGVFVALVDAEDLSDDDTGEYVTISYGLDGDDDDTVELGDFLSEKVRLTLGSGRGVAAKKVATRLTLHRGSTATNTPKVYETEVNARKKLQTLLGYRVPIDLAETARRQRVSVGTVLDRIGALVDTAVLFPVKLDTADGELLMEVADRAETRKQLHQSVTRTVGEVNGGVVVLDLEEVVS